MIDLRVLLLAGAALAFATAPAVAQDMKIAGTFGDWSLLTDSADPHQICFITSEPKSTSLRGASRQPPRAYISAWPKDGIKGEVSFRLGFPIKTSGEGIATVAPVGFKLFGSGDRAFVSDATQELKLVEAMKKGDGLTIAMTSERGTIVTDTYSLAGLGQALQKLRDTCFQ